MYDVNTCIYLYHMFSSYIYICTQFSLLLQFQFVSQETKKECCCTGWGCLSVFINTRHLSNPTFISLHQHHTPVQPYIYQCINTRHRHLSNPTFISLHQHQTQTPVQPYIYQSASTPDTNTCPTLHLSVCINTIYLSNPTFISLHQHQTHVQPYIYQCASTPDTCPTLHLSVCINTRHLSNPTVTIVSMSDTCLTLRLSAGVMREN